MVDQMQPISPGPCKKDNRTARPMTGRDEQTGGCDAFCRETKLIRVMSYLHVDFHYELLGISAAILALFALFGMARYRVAWYFSISAPGAFLIPRFRLLSSFMQIGRSGTKVWWPPW
jgi:hypothetical protein